MSMTVQQQTSSPEMLCLLEEMRDNPGAVSAYAASGVAAWALGEIERLRSHVASLDYIPLRYCDRPTGFVEERRKICPTPHICFEFGDRAPVCGPCDTAAVKALYQGKTNV